MRTLILLGAEISNGTSSAFLFVPDGASKLSRSIESILGKRMKIKGGMLAVFKRAYYKEVLVMQFLIRKFCVSEPRQKNRTKSFNCHSITANVLRFHICSIGIHPSSIDRFIDLLID